MQKRTMKELDSMGNLKFAIAILKERHKTLTNIYSPLSQKIHHTVSMLEAYDKQTEYDIQFDQAFKMLCRYGELQTVSDDGVSTFKTHNIDGYKFMYKYLNECTGIKRDSKPHDYIKIYTSRSTAK